MDAWDSSCPECLRSCWLSEQNVKYRTIRTSLQANTCGRLMESRVHASFRPHEKKNRYAYNQAFKKRWAGRLHVNASWRQLLNCSDCDSVANAFMQRHFICSCHQGQKNGEKSFVIFCSPLFFLHICHVSGSQLRSPCSMQSWITSAGESKSLVGDCHGGLLCVCV